MYFSCSVCFFGIWGNKSKPNKFVNPDSYTGSCKTTSVSFLGVKGYKSTGKTGVAYGGGKNIGKGAISISTSYYVRLSGKGSVFKNLKSKIEKKAKYYINKVK